MKSKFGFRRFALAAVTLWRREIVRFYRQPSRVIGALASPFLFWILIGSGLGNSFHTADASAQKGYIGYFFPGTLLFTIFFTSVFSTISLIEDRKEGFLQAVLVAPVSRAGIVLGKVLGGTSLSFLQAVLFLTLAPFLGIQLEAAGWARVGLALFLNGFLMTGMGVILAWQFESIQGFHAVMNLLLMPMWILSGALFPAEGASMWIQGIMKINPLACGLKALRTALYSFEAQPAVYWNSMGWTLIAALAVFFAAAALASQNKVRDLK